MPPTDASLEQIFQAHIQILALTLRPETVAGYRWAARRFLADLRVAFPQVSQLSQLRRDPHMLAWFRGLCEQQPPLCNKTRSDYLLCLRRLLLDLANDGHSLQPDLIRREDFPPPTHYLPRPLSPADDQLLLQQLRRSETLAADALLLTRLTGIRIGECIDLALDCLRQIGPDTWALHVPLGKLHTERLVPADDEVRQTVARILRRRASNLSTTAPKSKNFLLPRPGTRESVYVTLRLALNDSAKRAGCSTHVIPHRLRHSFASEMIRLGVSLPALMQMLGHKDIRMTLRYVQVTQVDLQREFHAALRNSAKPHRTPTLSVSTSPATGIPGILQALTATRHLLEMYRRQLDKEKIRRKLQRLNKRLLAVAAEVKLLDAAEK